MPSTTTTEYISSIALVFLGESLDPTIVSAKLGMDPHESWMRGQPKRVGKDLHQWGGWKRYLPEAQNSATVEEQMNYWIEDLSPKTEQITSIVGSGARCYLDVFVSGNAAWFKLSPAVTRELAAMPVAIEFTCWSSASEA